MVHKLPQEKIISSVKVKIYKNDKTCYRLKLSSKLILLGSLSSLLQTNKHIVN